MNSIMLKKSVIEHLIPDWNDTKTGHDIDAYRKLRDNVNEFIVNVNKLPDSLERQVLNEYAIELVNDVAKWRTLLYDNGFKPMDIE